MPNFNHSQTSTVSCQQKIHICTILIGSALWHHYHLSTPLCASKVPLSGSASIELAPKPLLSSISELVLLWFYNNGIRAVALWQAETRETKTAGFDEVSRPLQPQVGTQQRQSYPTMLPGPARRHNSHKSPGADSDYYLVINHRERESGHCSQTDPPDSPSHYRT